MDSERKGDLKRGVNFYWYYLAIPIFIAFFLINYYSQSIRVEALNIGLMISVVSFLFGFLVTINFTMLLNKLSALKTCLAAEAGRLTSLFLLSEHLGERFHKEITERIDSYTMKTLSHYGNYDVGREEIYEMHKSLKFMEVKTDYQKELSASFLYNLGEMQPVREQLEYLTSRKVELPIKISTSILGGLMIILLFLQRGDSFTNTLFIILSTVIIFILLIIEDYDDLRIGDYSYNISNSEEIFDLMGRERYYPSHLLNRVKLEEGRKYRIGFFGLKTKEEKVFLITSTPEFKSKINILGSKFKIN